ncbi:hypothetical protein HDE_07419 [Halotydeus destructor]|nr:hypothetical protein HDE_07419 [Halotydeus destructor]
MHFRSMITTVVILNILICTVACEESTMEAYVASSLRSVQNLAIHVLKNTVHMLANLVGSLSDAFGILTIKLGSKVSGMGARGLGDSMHEQGIAMVSFGETLKRWFGRQYVQSFNVNNYMSYGHSWEKFGSEYVKNRYNIEAYYSNQK